MRKATMLAMSLGLMLSMGYDALAQKLSSPAKKLEMNFELSKTGEPTYSLKLADGTVVTKTSRMGFEMTDSKLSFDKDFE
ncbi:MAG: glycoside hydrolase family 97 N-terminal domain-containing protein, partial [Porphyromonas sp.]|nr:glycoside hydrolase family 97 N-terminal domain-containing protein [Porphyromonas sp.]